MTKKKKLMLSIIVIVLILAVSVVLIFINNSNKYSSKYSNIRIYKRINFFNSDKKKIKLSSKDEKVIKRHLKEVRYSSQDELLNCAIIGIYIIKYDNYELSFDDHDCVAYLRDTKTNKYGQAMIPKELKDYVVKISK